MTKAQLLTLSQMSTSTVADIAKANPEVGAQLHGKLAAQRQSTVLSGFAGSSKVLLDTLRKVDFSPATHGADSPKQILLSSLTQQKLAANVAEEAAARITDLDRSGLLTDAADPSTPVAQHPLFQQELKQAAVYKLTDSVKLPDAKADALVAATGTPSLVSDSVLTNLVTKQTLTAAEASAIGLAAGLYRLTRGDTELTTALQASVKNFADIATLKTADWQKAITTARSTPPEGLDASGYAAALRRASTNLFPTTALMSLNVPPDSQALAPSVTAVAALAAKNKKVFGTSFESLDTTGIAAADLPRVRDAHVQLNTLANQHPGLGLHDVLNSNASAAEKLATLTSRLGNVTEVQQLNPTLELMGLDYTSGSADLAQLKMEGIAAADQQRVLSDLKSMQRVYSFTRDVDHTSALMAAGYQSALAIATERYDVFAQKTGLKDAAANQLYMKATSLLSQNANALISAVDAFSNIFNWLAVGNTRPEVQDYLKQIPGFADLFGSQDYCQCSECQSIIGAAAYFVDLMSFIEENVLNVVFTGAKANDQLNLKVRRPDLWTLALTCANTNNLVPYLEIINQTSENYIATRRGFAGDFKDRSAIEEAVYHQAIAGSETSFWQPFNLPLTKLDIYLEHFSVGRLDIARALSASQSAIEKAALKASNSLYNLLITPNLAIAFLNGIYGITFALNGNVVNALDVQLMLKATGYKRTDFGKAVGTLFVSNNGANNVQIKSEKSSPASVQNDVEHVYGLTTDALDRLHRFTRLLRCLPWNIAELDLVLKQLDSAGAANGIAEPVLNRIVQILDLQKRWNLPVDQNCALWSPIPQIALDSSQGTLFDRLFNFAPFVLLDGSLPKPAVKFIHSSFRQAGTPLPADNTGHRLLAGLQVSDNDLAALIRTLATPLGVDLTTNNENDRGFALTVANLTLLYRHALLANLLSLSLASLFQLIQLSGIPGGAVTNLDGLLALLTFNDWWRASGYSLDDLGLITQGPVLQPSNYPDKNAIAGRIVSGVTQDNALAFAPTVFAFLPGVTEQQSQQIIAANAALFEGVPNSTTGALRLTAAFPPAVAMNIPAGIPMTSADAVAALLKYHASQIIPTRLAGLLGVDADKIGALVSMTAADLSSAPFVSALKGGAIAPLRSLAGQLIPLKVLFSIPGFAGDDLTFIQQNGAIFGIGNFNAITLANVRSLFVYASTAVNLSDAAPLRTVFTAFTAAQRFAPADQTILATVLGISAPVLATIVPNVTLPNTPPEAFATLLQVTALARTLGLGGDSLKLILSDDYSEEARAADAVLSAFRAKYSAEQDFLDQLQPFDDRIRSRKRDALTDYILRSLNLPFATRDDLYNYFLLDVQLEGCARTSWVVAAISSAQLYVYRCLMNLEEDQRAPDDPAHIHVAPQLIPGDEWEWRKNFRVWQANRKVFLYPENYIEPELRDDKTPLFKDLESNLLQQPINEQNVLDAYAAYLSGFDEISKLRIAGSYQDIHRDTRSDILHLFGVTPGDPPTYYYRTIQNAIYGKTESDRNTVYSPWRPVSVQIPSRYVAPVMYLGRLFVFWTEVSTTPVNEVTGGGSNFTGYKHHFKVKYTSLRLDGTWTAPQDLTLAGTGVFPTGDGIVEDPLADQAEKDALTQALANFNFTDALQAYEAMRTPRYDTRIHTEPIDGYTLTGFQWDRVYPKSNGSLVVTGRNFVMRAAIDFYRKGIIPLPQYSLGIPPNWERLCSRVEGGGRRLYMGLSEFFLLDEYAWCSVICDERRIQKLAQTSETALLPLSMGLGLYAIPLAWIDNNADIEIINNSVGDAILDTNGDLCLLQSSVYPFGYRLSRLSTTLGERLCRLLFVSGVDGLLDIDSQSNLGESGPPLAIQTFIQNDAVVNKMDFKGSLGTYFREIFFHVPFLIANQLNSQQHYAAAQRWYHYIFNPTADDSITIPNNATPEQRAQMERDRVWRYIEFRNLDVPKLRDVLSDPAAIEAYKKDPFNPHAIARLRLSAYQKSIVMKYIDNILDWADSLFTEFTMESVNEATLLYVMALEILGTRPAEIGGCGQMDESQLTYAGIQPLLKKGSDFLVELETYTITAGGNLTFVQPKTIPQFTYTVQPTLPRFYLKEAVSAVRLMQPAAKPQELALGAAAGAGGGIEVAGGALVRGGAVVPAASAIRTNPSVPLPGESGLAQPYNWRSTYVQSWSSAKGKTFSVGANAAPKRALTGVAPKFTWGIVRHILPVFCIPKNDDLLQYWTRVEDRLYKIRHCQDITGTRRQLALFAPPINPMMLVEATAAGLALDDVLSSTSGDLPPYRFAYLIDKAKQYAAMLQSFGAELLSGIEKRDGEQLNILRLKQQQNILAMTTRMRQSDIDQAQNVIDSLNAQQATVQYRHDYYQTLADSGLNTWENIQAASRHAATISYIASSVLSGTGGVLSLLPQLGSPFAMKYGGMELGSSADAWSAMLRDTAKLAEVIAASAGLEAGFDRRDEGWRHQVALAQKELAQIGKQVIGATLRLKAAQRAMEIHQKTIDQTQAIFDFYSSRFSNLGLYTYLATTQQRLFRDAYTCAFAMAKLAEQAYRFERNDTTSTLLSLNYWDSSHGGLLSGESLLSDLQEMERRFIETNYRSLEVDQSISLSQVAPAALLELRETGTAVFDIPEVIFDLFYPGQYCRQIKAVRLTIPCVTGPFTNVGATLTLTGSKLRMIPQLGAANLVSVPLRRSVSISTSTAQSDSGVFEFSFRDERYMPFEGAGAVSSWSLSLPSTFRQFEYQTITDVILHISYTAQQDGVLRQNVEQQNAGLQGAILNVLSNQSLGRLFSLRQEFSSALGRLQHSAVATPVKLTVTDRHLPIYIRGRNMHVTKAELLLKTPSAQTVRNFQITIDGTLLNAFARDGNMGNLWSADVTAVFAAGLIADHTFTINQAGDLAPAAPAANDPSAIDDTKLLDLLVYIEYRLG